MAFAGQRQPRRLPVLEHLLKGAKRVRRWRLFATFAVVGTVLLVYLWLRQMGSPPVLYWAVWFLGVGLGFALAIWAIEKPTLAIRSLKWEIACARAAPNQPGEEPREWSRGSLALLVTLAVAILGLIGQIVAALISN